MNEPIATSKDTLDALLGRTRRRTSVPIRPSFLQVPRTGGGQGPLGRFVQARKLQALGLYLLFHAVAAAPPWDVTEAAGVWAGALGMNRTPSSEAAISRAWRWLEEQKLVKRQRESRALRVILQAEDGSGKPYEPPTGRGKQGRYLQLPFAYWHEDWHLRLDLPANAVLLIALSMKPEFELPQERAADWYGISADTIGRGLTRLEEHGLLSWRAERRAAPLARHGFTYIRYYRLLGAFAQRSAGAKTT